MDGRSAPEAADIAHKIARLAQERGWNRNDLARHASLSRNTVSQIMSPDRSPRLRNATVRACAEALGLAVSQLREWSLDQLLDAEAKAAQRTFSDSGDQEDASPALADPHPAYTATATSLAYEHATQPELEKWIARNPERARRLSAEEMDELLSLQGTGGHLTAHGLEYFLGLMERRRKLHRQLDIVAGTEYIALVEQLLGLLADKVQPYRDRA
jgi:transcriptional regulator with XRE-family HTH domain